MSQDLEWIDLQTYATPEEASELIELLKENSMNYNVVMDAQQMGDSLNLEFANRGISTVHVQVLQSEMERATRILDLASGNQVAEIEEDDYLSKFSDEELLEVLKKPDEWNRNDFQLAHKLLQQRGNNISEETLKVWFTDRVAEMAKPDVAGKSLIIAGYCLSVCGALIGFLIALQLVTFTKRLPTGQKVPMYGPEDKKHGRTMLAISLAEMAIIVAYLTIGFR